MLYVMDSVTEAFRSLAGECMRQLKEHDRDTPLDDPKAVEDRKTLSMLVARRLILTVFYVWRSDAQESATPFPSLKNLLFIINKTEAVADPDDGLHVSVEDVLEIGSNVPVPLQSLPSRLSGRST